MQRSRIVTEARRTLRSPGRLLKVFDRTWRESRAGSAASSGPEWTDDSTRPYASYDDYLAHQRSKMAMMDLSAYDREFQVTLRERLGSLPLGELRGLSVLCLAARLGTEVRAFHDHGAFAVGIDLEPGRDNRHVLPGDFHNIQWPADSVSLVYTNSLDHALELDTVVAEVRRVLRPGGRALVEVTRGEQEGGAGFGRWEARRWESAREVADAFMSRGFSLSHESHFEEPWPGISYILTS